jgi:RHS repeat-associated protein
MSSATQGATTNYTYNALGQMIEKSGATTTLLMYDLAGHLIGEYTGAGTLIQETVWLGDIPVATLRPNGTGISIYYVHADQLGAPRLVTRPADNAIMWRWDTDPFGTSAPNSNPQAQGTFVYNLRFPGQYYQAETGLNYNYFRDYDPGSGRYVESDPTGLGGGVNTYAYANGNALSNTDPRGQFVPLATAAIGAAAGFGGSVIGQLISNGGNFKCVNWGNALIAGGVGAVAGAAAPFVATSWLGATVLGASANTAQYEITQFANGQSTTAADAAWNAGTGALGGVIGGLFRYPSVAFSTSSPWLNAALARSANIDSQSALNLTSGNFFRNLFGSSVSNVDRPGSGSGSTCGCN